MSAIPIQAMVVPIDSNVTPLYSLPAYGEFYLKKAGNPGPILNFQVSVVGQTMCLELQNGLDIIGSVLHVKMINGNWEYLG